MIVVVASRDLEPTAEVNTAVAEVVQAEGGVLVRCDNDGNIPSRVERLAFSFAVAHGLGYGVEHPNSQFPGRAGVYYRDFKLVTNASRVLAFFPEGSEMDGGTGHVVKAALDRGVPVEAYGVRSDGTVWLIGSDDGDDRQVFGWAQTPNDILLEMYHEPTDD